MSEQKEYVDKINGKASLLRGFYLNQNCIIEKIIDFYIAGHFCSDEKKKHEIIDLLLGDRFVSFESKRTVFEILLKNHNEEFYKANKPMLVGLTTIQTHRNKFAHLIAVTSDEAIERYKKDESVGLIKYKEKTEILWYTKKETDELTKTYHDVHVAISSLFK